MAAHVVNEVTEVLFESREAIQAAVENETLSEADSRKINFRNCHLSTTTTAAIASILRKNRRFIEEIVLDRCTGRVDIVLSVAFAIATPVSVTILLGYPPSTSFDPVAHSIGVGLLTSSTFSVLRIDIGSKRGFFTLTTDAASSFEQGMAGNPNLESLLIDNCRFAESSALRIFASGLRKAGSLRNVRLASCYEPNGQPLEDRNISFLIQSLEQNSNLRRLDVSGNKCLDEGIGAVASIVDRTQVRHINVASQKMDSNETMNTFFFVGTLARTTTLEVLELQSNKLYSDHHMANLAAGLSHNMSLKHIDLSNNNLTSSGINILSSRIPQMEVLKSLFIDGSDSLDEFASEGLKKAMKVNTTIQMLTCDRHLIDYEMIQYYTDLNRCGRRFLFRREEKQPKSTRCNTTKMIPSSLWPMIFALVGTRISGKGRRANVVYFLLSRNPHMILK